ATLLLRPFPIDHWDAQRAETMAMLAPIRQQVASTPPGQVATIENQLFGLSHGFPAMFPGWVGMFVVFFPDNTVDGRPVRFLVSEDDFQRAQARAAVVSPCSALTARYDGGRRGSTRISPSCTTDATRVPSRRKMAPCTSPRPANATGLVVT